MALNQDSTKGVLIVVDVQVGVMRNAWDAPRIIKNVGIAVEKARRHGVPVIWVQHSDGELEFDTPDWQIVQELSPAKDEIQIHKHYNSSFAHTPLHETLTTLGATHIVLVGAATNWCIRATAYAALDRGHNLTLIKDAHTTETMELGDGINIEAEDVIRELNTVMTWLSYPDCTSRSEPVEEVDFADMANKSI